MPGNPELTYRLADIRPHPYDPITDDTFNQLDREITGINAELGIESLDHNYASSLPGRDNVGISVVRSRETNHSRSLSVAFYDTEHIWTVRVLNKCGTLADPYQPAADAKLSPNKRGLNRINLDIHDISETSLLMILAAVKDRRENGYFVKKHYQTAVYGHFGSIIG